VSETQESGPAGAPQPEDAPAPRRGLIGRVKAWAERHKTLLWWLHSFYALGLGVMVILFAQKGFGHARVLAATLGGVVIVMLILFRVFGHGDVQRERVDQSTKSKVRFILFTYVLKNLYQPMLFFVLPFYWKASSLDSVNGWFIFLLGTMAFISTMDLIFDQFLVRFRAVAATYYGITLFACINLVIPAFFPNLPTLVTLLASAGVSVLGFWLLHFPLRRLLERRSWLALGVSIAAFMTLVYVGRRVIPPVPLYVQSAAIGDYILDDGRLAVELVRVHTSRLTDLYAVTEVALPGGEGDTLHHVWRHRDGRFAHPARTTRSEGLSPGTVRLSSALQLVSLPNPAVGRWTVDVMTQDGQLVGRARFEVIE